MLSRKHETFLYHFVILRLDFSQRLVGETLNVNIVNMVWQ